MNYTLLSRRDSRSRGEKENDDKRNWLSEERPKPSIPYISLSCTIILLTLFFLSFTPIRSYLNSPSSFLPSDKQILGPGQTCPQFPAIKPVDNGLMKVLEEEWGSEEFKKGSVERMRRAIGIRTESFDDMGEVGVDERWDVFGGFRELLGEIFPVVYERLEVTKINTHGLVYEWKGSDSSLKPYIFMAHQDVVPVPPETVDRWTYPPFSGEFDGEFVWGRGASDCKNNLIGIMEAMESLLSVKDGWQPKRTIIAAFGFDEEISGWKGARFIAEWLEEKYGLGGVELVVDEGGLGISDVFGKTFAMPALGEKGYLDIRVTVETQGGHSSVPPAHTGIGILSKVISVVEDHPHEPDLTPANPFFTTLQCEAEHSPDIPSLLRSSIKAAAKSKVAAKALAVHLANTSLSQKYLMQTSQATDLISGGLKINALPEKVSAVINHRIAVESNISSIANRLSHIIQMSIAQPYNFELVTFGESISTPSNATGRISLDYFDEPLQPAPVSPLDTKAYEIFSGTIKQVLGEDIIVAPSIMTGNTDTKYFWGLSRNIYRFTPVEEGGRFDAHTVDERVKLSSHLMAVKFYAALMVNSEL